MLCLPARLASRAPTCVPAPPACLPCPRTGATAAAHFGGVDGVAAVTGVLGAFLAIQATRVRFVFDDEALQVCWV